MKILWAFLLVVLLLPVPEASSAERSPDYNFTVITPETAKAGDSFAVKIVARDEFNAIVADYDQVGPDVELTTTGFGTIKPALLPASSFKDGIATLDCVYDQVENFVIVAKAKVTLKPKHRRTQPTKKEQKRIPVEKTQTKEYLIGEEDVLNISAWGWPDLTTEVIVRPDGKISFPLVGDLQASGQSLTELDNDLTERLKEYIKDPQVSVMIKEFGGRKVIVLGEVNYPGVYKTSGKNTVMEVIARSGGFTDAAVRNSIILIRGDLNDPEARRINLNKVIKEGDPSGNIVIEQEDVVYVPRTFIGNIGNFLRQLSPMLSAADFQQRWD
ncbi:MAG: polysaccharide biosynthesis/export family protein [Candidatus Omnitrophica bacterium]|nr:polysaccharide biosynthesis/export family protein [Candidatus Omnitrophota bacterium]